VCINRWGSHNIGGEWTHPDLRVGFASKSRRGLLYCPCMLSLGRCWQSLTQPRSGVVDRTWCRHYAVCGNITKEDIGVGHSADVYLTFNDPRLNDTDRKVGFQIIDYWVRES
jgi:hypothetical protein